MRKKALLFTLSFCLLLSGAGCTRRDPVPTDRSSSLAESEGSESGPEAPGPASGLGMEAITAGIGLELTKELIITRPSMDISMSGEAYYITGTSDPGLPLLLDGQEVADRGRFGSFGVFVSLEPGDNTFRFTQGDAGAAVTITRDDDAVSTTDAITKPAPLADDIVQAGREYALSCVAPSGAAVTATVNGQTIQLAQRAATAVSGVPATFTGSFTPPDQSGVAELGPVTYRLTWGGETTEAVSGGSITAVGSTTGLVVAGRHTASSIFVEESEDSDCYATLQAGAVTRVTEFGADMVALEMGGWIGKDKVIPLADATVENKAAGADYRVEAGAEILTIAGGGKAPYRWKEGDGEIGITLFHLTGVPAVDAGDSALFSDLRVEPNGQADTELVLTLRPGAPYQGFLVEYQGGDLVITFLATKSAGTEQSPLSGLTILLDPGHGGSDGGADGVPRFDGPPEKEITLATTKAVGAYLTGLGATVVYTRTTDEYSDLSVRQAQIQQPEIDAAISLHCNSISYSTDGTGPSGTEVFYFTAASKPLAESLVLSITDATGRKNRGAKYGNYRIVLNPNTPSVMVELGFLTNPAEYDALCDTAVIYDTAVAIGKGLAEYAALR